ncbi:MAG: NAD-dependent epimerase/dehydratase family protein [Halioglobus sp.]
MSRQQKIVTVTGATGFVGRVLVRRLLEEPDVEIRCLVRPGSDRSELLSLGSRVSFCSGDITQPHTLGSAMKGAWGVINLAGYREFWARKRSHFYKVNTEGAENVFQACLNAGVKKVVQVSTPLAYGVPDTLPFKESSVAGAHPNEYGRSKHLGDAAGLKLCENQQLPLSIVYLAAVIGAGDDKETMEVARAVEKRLPALVGADTTYTYVYVQDAAEAIVRALLKPANQGEKYLIGDQRATTREYFNLIGEIADVPIPSRNIPESWLLPIANAMEYVARATGRRPVIPLDVIKTTAAGSLLFDSDYAKKELQMQYTPLRHALEEAVEQIRR